jgi:hypothetical protein
MQIEAFIEALQHEHESTRALHQASSPTNAADQITWLLHSESKAHHALLVAQQLWGSSRAGVAAGAVGSLPASAAALTSCVLAAQELLRDLQAGKQELFDCWQVGSPAHASAAEGDTCRPQASAPCGGGFASCLKSQQAYAGST